MRTAWNVISVLLLLHLVALIGGGFWLHSSGRLSRQRLHAAVEIFRPTLEEERAREAHAADLARQAQEVREQAAHLQSVALGPRTVADRLQEQDLRDSIAEARVQRLQRDILDLQRRIESDKQMLLQQKSEIEAREGELRAAIERETKLRNDRDFKQAVAMYEQLRARQAKEIFQKLLAEGRTDDVVDYLAAMQLRKAAAVLKEFKETSEIGQATVLLQRLRDRGIRVDPADPTPAGPTPETPSPAAATAAPTPGSST